MSNISVNIFVLLLVGIPQSFLTVLALQIFTRTKMDAKKYMLLSIICLASTYLIRLLPIALGVNTVLTLLILILSFQLAYKNQLSRVIRTIMSAIIIFVLIAFTEVLNMLLLSAIYSQSKAIDLLDSSDELLKGICYAPSNIFFVIFIFIGYFLLKLIEKRDTKDGATSEKTGE